MTYPSDIFRQEAVDYHSRVQSDGEILLMLPGWAKWTYRLLVVLFVAALAFLTFATVPQYAEGPALIRAERGRFSVLAFLPGQPRPPVQPGQLLRLELSAPRHVYQNLAIGDVDDRIFSPSDVQHIAGPVFTTPISVTGPVVVVRASLPGSAFTSGDEVYQYFDGMRAVARVRVRSERLLTTLIPGVKQLAERSR